MPGWQNSDRRDRLPPDWPERRLKVLERDGHRCKVIKSNGRRCPNPANEVDHVKRGDDHRLENLASICNWHHKAKSSSEGGQAAAAGRRAHAKKFDRTESHPGLL